MSRSHPVKDINTEESKTPFRQTLKQQREREGEGDKCIDAVAFFPVINGLDVNCTNNSASCSIGKGVWSGDRVLASESFFFFFVMDWAVKHDDTLLE